jgi:hypothetical protein
MRKRSFDTSFLQKPKRKPPQKKVCELGNRCPYKDEYQHMLEFSHDTEPRVSSNNQSARSYAAFSGSGNRLGTAPPGSGWSSSSINSTGTTGSKERICCDICSQMISLESLDAHFATHDKRSDGLKQDQDAEYERSLYLDMQKRHAAEQAERAEQERKQAEEEAKELADALAISLASSNASRRTKAVADLLDEPDASYEGQTISLKFTLSSGAKHKRTFRTAFPLRVSHYAGIYYFGCSFFPCPVI